MTSWQQWLMLNPHTEMHNDGVVGSKREQNGDRQRSSQATETDHQARMTRPLCTTTRIWELGKKVETKDDHARISEKKLF
jgi:hypothetical protein